MAQSTGASNFITTETLTDDQGHEKEVWDAVRRSFSDRKCLGYSHYPLYETIGESRDEPDIMVADPQLGIVVIEVRPFEIEDVKDVNREWDLGDRSVTSPAEVGKKKLKRLIRHAEGDRLFGKVGGRSFVALPNIEESEWRDRGFDQEVGDASILFSGDLGKKTLRKRIENATPFQPQENLSEEEWKHLQSALGGNQIYQDIDENRPRDTSTRAGVVTELRERLHDLDLQQEHIGKEIPPGPQRIRGIAGSGKTVLLCQKAAHMHLKHPDWDIALVFFTRSLYDQIESLTERWIKRFSSGERQTYDPNQLQILHAWGGSNRPGLYSEICRAQGVDPLNAGDTDDDLSPTESLAEVCKRFLEENDVQPQYDAVLIDEGQDLVVDDKFRYEGRQPIYWLAYEALRNASENGEEDRRRLIWAYDEAQSLDSLKIPKAKELFGENLSRIVSGTYEGGIKKSEIMSRCYRTPGPILVAAHALGMGLKRDGRMIAGFTRQEDWEAIGYEVDGNFTSSGNEITLMRPEENSPNPVPDLWKGDVIKFDTFDSRREELNAVARQVRHNLEDDGLQPSRDILIVVLGDKPWELEKKAAQALQRHNIDSYVATALDLNVNNPRFPDNDPDRFWHDGGVTVSRIHRAKGNEAEVVYVIGLDKVAGAEAKPRMRNQLFVGLTRSEGWAYLSGVGDHLMYDEVGEVIDSKNIIEYKFSRPLRDMGEGAQTELSI